MRSLHEEAEAIANKVKPWTPPIPIGTLVVTWDGCLARVTSHRDAEIGLGDYVRVLPVDSPEGCPTRKLHETLVKESLPSNARVY